MKKYKLLALFILTLLMTGNAHAFEMGMIDIHGFVSQGYLITFDNNLKPANNFATMKSADGTFEFNELGLNFVGWLTADIRLGIQLFARDFGLLGNDTIQIDWAYADYHWGDWLGLRVGKLKIPTGLYNEIRDIDILRPHILLPQGNYQEMVRDTMIAMKGGGIYGKTPYGVMGALGYQVMGGTVDIPEGSGAGAMARNFNASSKGFDVEYTLVAHLQWLTPLDGLQATASWRTIKFDSNFEVVMGSSVVPITQKYYHMIFAAGGLEYIIGDLIIAGEYLYIDSNADMFIQVSPFFTRVQNQDRWSDGYYGSVSYRVNDWFMPAFYYAEAYASTAHRTSDPDRYLKDFCTTLRFDFGDSWITKVEYHLMRGKYSVLLPAIDNPEGINSNWHLVAAKLTYSF